MGTDGVEIAQSRYAPARFTLGDIGQQLFDSRFGLTVGIGRLNAGTFRDWQRLGDARERGGAAEHDRAAGVSAHGLQQAARALDVDVPVAERLVDRVPHRFEAGEVKNGRDTGAVPGASGSERPIQVRGASDITVDEDQLAFARGRRPFLVAALLTWAEAAELGDAMQCLHAAVLQVVDNNHAMARTDQDETGVAADEAGSSSDQDSRQRPLPFMLILRDHGALRRALKSALDGS